MKAYRYCMTAHTEIDIAAENKEKADKKAEAEWQEMFRGLFGDVEFIKEVEEK